MSRQAINKVLGLALVDEMFASKLLEDPCEALRVYDLQLPQRDLEVICTCRAQTLYELSQQLIEKLGSDQLE